MMVYQCINWLSKLYKKTDYIGAQSGVGHRNQKSGNCQDEVQNEKQDSPIDAAKRIAREFDFDDGEIQRAVGGFVQQLQEGLQRHGCSIEQLPSFIKEIPTGHETGTCLTVDLGGTNIRVCWVKLKGDGTYSMRQDRKLIPKALMTSSSKELFHWVATTVRDFIENVQQDTPQDFSEEKFGSQILDLGFTFSHAVDQRSINSGKLIRWSKGFDIEDTVDQDVCALLQNAFDELKMQIRVTALINDTVGTLLAQAYKTGSSARTILGAVFGTGTNGAYIERSDNVTKNKNQETSLTGIMIMNTEWGNFDQELKYLPTTEYDRALDLESVNPGIELFEKRISGMYLGELLRRALLALQRDCTNDFPAPLVIPDHSRLHLHGAIDSSLLSDLEADKTSDLSLSRARIEQYLGIYSASLEVVEAIRIVSKAIARRSARLSAVAVGAVLLQTNCLAEEPDAARRIEVGVDGSLVELYPGFIDQMRDALICIGGIGCDGAAHVDIVIAKDGSGIGAALAAYLCRS